MDNHSKETVVKMEDVKQIMNIGPKPTTDFLDEAVFSVKDVLLITKIKPDSLINELIKYLASLTPHIRIALEKEKNFSIFNEEHDIYLFTRTEEFNQKLIGLSFDQKNRSLECCQQIIFRFAKRCFD